MPLVKTVYPAVKQLLDGQMRRLRFGKHRPHAKTADTKRVPGLPSPQQIGVWEERLRTHHEEYVRTVSSREMAASLECLAFCVAICENRGVRRILDAGSGISSLLFRTARSALAPSAPGWEVISVDDDASWLNQTRNYLRRNGCEDDARVILLDEFLSRAQVPFDFVFYDLGLMPTRQGCLGKFVELSAGLIYLDDVHKTVYRRHVEAALRPERLFNVQDLTHDKRGRFGYVYITT